MPGWESRSDAVARFDSALDEVGGDRLVIATHGTVLSLWLAHRFQRFDPVEFWLGLEMPDARLLSADATNLMTSAFCVDNRFPAVRVLGGR